MASVIVAGDVSGTCTLQAPSAAGSTVLTLPVIATDTLAGIAATQTLTNKTLTSPTITGATITVAATAAPAFSAYKATGQTISNSVYTKMIMDTEEFDTNSNFDSTTNYRFTPTVAGYYQATVQLTPTTATTVAKVSIYKNGVATKENITFAGNVGTGVSNIISMNGSTDYLEFYGYFTGTTPGTVGGANWTYFQAAMIRSA